VAEEDKTVIYEISGQSRETLAASARRYVRTFAASPTGKDLALVSQGDSFFIELTTWETKPDKVPLLKTRRFHDNFVGNIATADYHPTKDEFAFSASQRNGQE